MAGRPQKYFTEEDRILAAIRRKLRWNARNPTDGRNRYHTKRGFLLTTHREMRFRCSKLGEKRQCLVSRDDFLRWALLQPSFHQHFESWANSGYERRHAPSIDRINNDGHYEFGNMQFLSQVENSIKGNIECPRKRSKR